MDLYSRETAMVPAHGSAVFKTGVHIELPHCTAGILKSKSGLNVLHDITSDGTIDDGYTGEIVVKLYNHGDHDYWVYDGDKISQLLIVPVRYEKITIVDRIAGGERGDCGFGSTGK
jgi:dUTP pyrophosphatase